MLFLIVFDPKNTCQKVIKHKPIVSADIAILLPQGTTGAFRNVLSNPHRQGDAAPIHGFDQGPMGLISCCCN